MLLKNREAGKANISRDCGTREKLIFFIPKSEEPTFATQTEKIEFEDSTQVSLSVHLLNEESCTNRQRLRAP